MCETNERRRKKSNIFFFTGKTELVNANIKLCRLNETKNSLTKTIRYIKLFIQRGSEPIEEPKSKATCKLDNKPNGYFFGRSLSFSRRERFANECTVSLLCVSDDKIISIWSDRCQLNFNITKMPVV